MWGKFTNWLAANFYISPEDIATHQQVADAEQAQLDRQFQEGKRSTFDYFNLSNDVQSATDLQDFKAANSGLWGFVKIFPWWFWLLLVLVLAWWVGAFSWVRGIFAKKGAAQ